MGKLSLSRFLTGRFHGKYIWDPRRILCQIEMLQILFYVVSAALFLLVDALSARRVALVRPARSAAAARAEPAECPKDLWARDTGSLASAGADACRRG